MTNSSIVTVRHEYCSYLRSRAAAAGSDSAVPDAAGDGAGVPRRAAAPDRAGEEDAAGDAVQPARAQAAHDAEARRPRGQQGAEALPDPPTGTPAPSISIGLGPEI